MESLDRDRETEAPAAEQRPGRQRDVREALREEPGQRQQHRRDRNLRGGERAVQAEQTATSRRVCSPRLDHDRSVCAGSACGRDQRDEHDGRERRDDGEQHGPWIEADGEPIGELDRKRRDGDAQYGGCERQSEKIGRAHV